jgi:Domain of unknown function (DUF4082)
MGLGSGNLISDLNEAWPLGTDPKKEGDDHLRLLKHVVKNDAATKADLAGKATILNGTATPTAATGSIGNYYVDTDDHILYGPKASISIDSVDVPFDTQSGGTYEFGSRYKFLSAGYCTGIKFFHYSGDTTASGMVVSLWDSASNALLAQKSVASPTPGAWNSIFFDTPVAVVTNTNYIVSVWYPGRTFVYQTTWPGTAMVSGNVRLVANGEDDGTTSGRYATAHGFPANQWTSTAVASPLFQTAVGSGWPAAVPGWVQMTQAAYDALGTKNPNTMYVIVG